MPAQPNQPKNIVLCSDGTGNAPAKGGEGTNVWKLFRAVDVHRRNRQKKVQMAFYDDGVGTGRLKLFKLLGGAFGWGLSRNIRDLYTSLVHHYDPGDCIFLLGFSRGAFTVRSLVGFICLCGLVDRRKTPLRPRLKWDWLFPWRLLKVGKPWSLEGRVREAFKVYRRARKKAPPTGREPQRPIEPIQRERESQQHFQRRSKRHKRRMERFEKRLKRFEQKRARDERVLKEIKSRAHESFRQKFSVKDPDWKEGKCPGCKNAYDIPIKCIGVWDTVDAVGLPVDELTDALDLVFKFKFHRHDLDPCVEHGFHALSIDDERHTFHPVLWDESRKHEDQHIEQVWFAGVHCNVGGGYPKDQMALVALHWMMRKVSALREKNTGAACGLHFRRSLWREWSEEANVHGKLYDSRSGFGAYFRYRPRNIHELSEMAQQLGPGQLPKVHYSVLERIREATEDYAPANLPKEFEIVDSEEDSEGWEKRLEREEVGKVEPEDERPADTEPEPWWGTLGLEPGAVGKWWKALDPAWDTIWLRRGLYFTFIALSIFFVWMGWWLSAGSKEPCQPGSASEFECEVGWSIFDYLFDLAIWAAPAIAEGAILGFRNNPFWVFAFLLVAVTLFKLRKRVIGRTVAVCSVAWKIAWGEGLDPLEPNWRERIARKIRLSSVAGAWNWIKKKIVPWVFLLGSLLGLLWLLWWVAVPSEPDAPSSACGAGQVAEPLEPGASRSFLFETSCPCQATEVLLEAGGRYRIEVETWREEGPEVESWEGELGSGGVEPPLEEWCDASFSASPEGLRQRGPESRCPPGLGEALSPEDYLIYRWFKVFRRSWWHDWFALLGSVGPGDDYRFKIGSGVETHAAKTGRLYLYVNDAVCYFCPGGPWYFYTWVVKADGEPNNRGTARITVRRLDGEERPSPSG